jgi:hypothetical protein
MASPYANGTPTGGQGSSGSAYARGTPAVGPSAAPKKSGGGGLFDRIVGGVEGAAKSGAHFIGSKADLTAHDIAAMPGGLVQVGKAFGHDLAASVEHPGRQIGPTWGQILSHPERALSKNANGSQLDPLIAASAKGAQVSFQHPLRDPFQTLLNAAAVAAPVAGAASRGAAAAEAARAGDVGLAAKALVSKPTLPPRMLKVPKLVSPEGEGPAALTHTPVQLQASQAPLARAAQALHDSIVQRSLNRNAVTAEPSRLANYAGRRVGKVTSETARTAQRTNAVPAQMLERAGRSFDKGVKPKLGQLALFLRSANVTGDEAARFWGAQAAAGVNPGDTGALAKLAAQVHERGLLTTGPDGKVIVDAAKYPSLDRVDQLTKENQASREGIIREHGLMTPEGMQNRLNLVPERMGSEAARSDVTGVREGQGYTPLKTSVKRQPQSPFAASRTPVIGKVRNFITAKPATGEGVAKGLIPDNTTAGVARANREALRYLNTVQHRGLVARYGSDVRRTGQDVLVADPAATRYGELSPAHNELLGRSKSTLNTISEQEHQGLAAAMQAKLDEAIRTPKNDPSVAAAGLGTRAPEGYKWVPQQMLGELVQETTPRTGLTKAINNVNSAVTAMTVYFKLSHIPQRFTTNATTSVLSGALKPGPLKAAVEMRKALSDREYAEAVAASGVHGYMALPHEGVSRSARVATVGAQFYAHRVDSPFRFLNLVHEARQAGFGTPEKFRALIEHAKNPTVDHGSAGEAAQAAKMDYVLRRANRVSMIYDGLGAGEKRFLARGLWFYPWTKAAVRFAGHTIAEHPLKSAAGAAAGKLGEQQQQNMLGAIPSYEYGLTPFGPKASPKTADFAVLTPFGTAGNVIEALARPGGIAGQLNPAYGAALTAGTGINQYGAKTKSPIGDALAELFAPTPEAQILGAYMHPARPTQIFQKTPLSQLVRSVGGPSVPRKTNRTALNKAAAREKSGR